MLDFAKYKRFFAFGCSMTSYGWPTWADIIAQEIPEYHNYAQSGGGNLFISCQVTEADLKHNFTDGDLIMIMWSSVAREDRHVKGNWLTPGNIYTQGFYDDKFVTDFADEVGYLLRDINLITLIKQYLQTKSCDYYMLNMSPFTITSTDNISQMKYRMICATYKSTFDSILPDLLTLGMNGKWPQHPITKKGHQSADYHPSPIQHFGYLQKLFPKTVWSNHTMQFLEHEQEIMEAIVEFDDMLFRVNNNRI